jgi:hypothetical protein
MQYSTWFYSRVGVAQFVSQLIAHCLALVRMPGRSSTEPTRVLLADRSQSCVVGGAVCTSLHFFCFQQQFNCRPVT